MPDLNDVPSVVYGTLAVVGGIGAVTSPFIIRAVRLSRRVGHFLDDWNGEEARPGVPRRPGMLERMEAQEQVTATVAEQVGVLSDHIAPLTGDQGVALRAAMDRAERRHRPAAATS